MAKFEVEWTLNGQAIEVDAPSYEGAKIAARAILEHILDDIAGEITIESVAEVVEVGSPKDSKYLEIAPGPSMKERMDAEYRRIRDLRAARRRAQRG